MIYYRTKNGIKLAEIWYNPAELPDKKVDILRYRFVKEKHVKATSIEEKYTLLSDLTNDEKELFSKIHKNTKYKINRAKERDNIECSTFFAADEKNTEKLSQYLDFFNTFADSKGRSSAALSEFEQFFEKGTLYIRSAMKDNTILAMHAYIVSDNIARLHQSASHFRDSEDSEYRNLVGRANRFLHWDDMMYFKSFGVSWYDFGGWYAGHTDKEKLLIGQFKESFGGEKCREYLYIVPVSVLGNISVYVHAVFRIGERINWRFKKTFRKIFR
ncbi:hypothetical protein LQZ19_14625 [Treponema primitia]|uniref:hypothetical protein n=1 Tax=Treponema primitia TaxID=88058 RepID=UPI00397F34CC